jgi:ABC-type multidrug transport system fused ATPase/permease subunit
MEGAGAAVRVCDILDTPLPDPSDTPAARSPRRTRVDLRTADIVLHDVSVTHPARDEPALDRVNLVIASGVPILVTGPSGAGKSTLLALLLRFAHPAAGTIEAGGTALEQLDVAAWRAQLAWVPQQPHLFTGTVADNIAIGRRGAGRRDIEEAARQAGANEFIEALPQGYATPLGDRAARLSAGQRQRVALARAFLRDAPLLLLDEPTAHLDAVTAARILAVIDTLSEDRTVVMVSHGTGRVSARWRAITVNHGRLVVPDGGEAAAGENQSLAAAP